MKTTIHPSYQPITVSCACGSSVSVGSILTEDTRVEICAHCHPLYTGKSKLIDTAGRVDKFEARRKAALAHKEAKSAKSPASSENTDK